MLLYKEGIIHWTYFYLKGSCAIKVIGSLPVNCTLFSWSPYRDAQLQQWVAAMPPIDT